MIFAATASSSGSIDANSVILSILTILVAIIAFMVRRQLKSYDENIREIQKDLKEIKANAILSDKTLVRWEERWKLMFRKDND